MPKIVNHEERREFIARVSADIIADQKKDQAEKEAYAREKQRQFQELEKKLGMD